MKNDGFLTTEEVLDYLQVNLRTVYRLIKAGKIPAVRVGRQWRFRKRDIDAWLESQRPAAAGRGARRLGRSVAPQRTSARARRGRRGEGSAICCRRRWSSRNTTSISRRTDATALERLRMMPYDLLITDLRMPGVDGLTVIREARRLKPRSPVIIITGYSTEATAIEAIELGVQGYLTKPFRVPRVLNAAAKALGETVI